MNAVKRGLWQRIRIRRVDWPDVWAAGFIAHLFAGCGMATGVYGYQQVTRPNRFEPLADPLEIIFGMSVMGVAWPITWLGLGIGYGIPKWLEHRERKREAYEEYRRLRDRG